MNIDFPNNPIPGQNFTDHNSTVWVYDNARWRRKMPSVIPGTPNFYSSSTEDLDNVSMAVAAIVPVPPQTLIDVYSDKLTAAVLPEAPVDGMVYFVDRDLSQGANNLAAGVWRFTVDPALGLNEWVHVFNYQSGDGIQKVPDLAALATVLPVTVDGDLVETLDDGRVYVRRETPDRFEALNRSYHIVADLADRDALVVDQQSIEGTLCYVQSTGTMYQMREPKSPKHPPEWWEFPSVPDHTVRDQIQRLEYDPSRPVGDQLLWVDDRETPAVVADEAELLALTPVRLSAGKLVYVKSTGMLLRYTKDATTHTGTADDWVPLIGGLTYVGRFRDLPNPALTNLVDGQMFIVRMDMGGKDLYRLLSWDASIPNVNQYVALNQLTYQVTPAIINATTPVTPPDTLEIQFVLPPQSVIGQEGMVGFRISWKEDTTPHTQSFLVPVQPGDSPVSIATFLEAKLLADLPAGEIAPTQQGARLTLTPREAVPPVVPTNDVGPVTAIPASPAVGDWGLVTQDLHIGGVPVPSQSTILFVGAGHGAGGWIIRHPTVTGAVTFNVSPGGNPAHHGAQLSFAGATNLNYFAVGSSHTAGNYMIATGNAYTFPAPDPQYPEMTNLAGQQVNNGDFIIREASGDWVIAPMGGQLNTDIRAAYVTANQLGVAQPVSVGGTLVPAPTPPADWQEPNTSPHHVEITAITDALVPSGTVKSPPNGGWRYLNREIWRKALRVDANQPTDQRGGDVQFTLENQHKEIKVFDQGVWHDIYSEDDVKTWIASLSLFEGTAQEVGGSGIGADHLDTLPDVTVAAASQPIGLTSHYWTWVGTPGYVIPDAADSNALANGLSRDLAGLVLNPGDWLQLSNRGGDGSGAGANGGPPDMHWVSVGGDLLAKSRGDLLYGLQPWVAGGWEQGALVVHQGDVYRATQPVVPTDVAPNATGLAVGRLLAEYVVGRELLAVRDGEVDVQASVVVFSPLDNAGNDQTAVLTALAANDTIRIQEKGTQNYWDVELTATPVSVNNTIRLTNATVTLTGTKPAVGATLEIHALAPAQPPWERLDISGGLKVAQTDADLPATAPPGQVWLVLSSAKGGGKQALYAYDAGAVAWQELGGGGTPLDMTGGQIAYTRNIHHAGQAPADLTDASVTQPSQVGDTLTAQIANGDPLLLAVSRDGSTWSRVHPFRFVANLTGAGRPAQADYPLQPLVGIQNNVAKITHFADRNLDWVEVAGQAEINRQARVTNRSWSTYYDCSDGFLVFEGMAHVSGGNAYRSGLWFKDSGLANQDVFVTISKMLIPSDGGNTFYAPNRISVRFNANGDYWIHNLLDQNLNQAVEPDHVCHFKITVAHHGNVCSVMCEQTYFRAGWGKRQCRVISNFEFEMNHSMNLIAWGTDLNDTGGRNLDSIVTFANLGVQP